MREINALSFGYKLPEEQDKVITLLLYVPGIFVEDIGSGKTMEEKRAFSTECELFSASGSRCKKCAHIIKMYAQQRERKKNNIIHPMCNKLYPSNEELQSQLTDEKTEED